MEEKSMMPMEEAKERKVEIVKDINSGTESEKEIALKKEQERQERKFLIQLIVVFCTWIFLIILLMRNEKKNLRNQKHLPHHQNKQLLKLKMPNKKQKLLLIHLQQKFQTKRLIALILAHKNRLQ